MADMFFNSQDRDWGEFYNSLGRTDLSPNPSSVPSGDLTTRSVKTVAIDPYTGQPKLTATPSFQPGMMGRGITSVGSLNLTAAEQQLLSQQIQQSQALQAGYNPDGTPKPMPIRPSWSIPTPVSVPTALPIDQAAYNATKKPGTWLAQSRMQAQALMRQMAALQGGMPMVPAVAPAAPARGGLAALITGKGTPRAKSTGGLVSLLGAAPEPKKATGTSTNGYVYDNGVRVGKDPQYAGMSPSQMYDAINRKSGNSSSSGNRLGEYLGAS